MQGWQRAGGRGSACHQGEQREGGAPIYYLRSEPIAVRFFFQERSFSAETASALRYWLLPLQRCRRSPAPSGLQLASLLEHARTWSLGCSALRDAEACRCRGSPSDGVGGMVARRSRMSSPNFFQGHGDEDTCDRSAFSRLLTLTDCRASLCFDCICFSATDVGCESPYSRMSTQACFSVQVGA